MLRSISGKKRNKRKSWISGYLGSFYQNIVYISRYILRFTDPIVLITIFRDIILGIKNPMISLKSLRIMEGLFRCDLRKASYATASGVITLGLSPLIFSLGGVLAWRKKGERK